MRTSRWPTTALAVPMEMRGIVLAAGYPGLAAWVGCWGAVTGAPAEATTRTAGAVNSLTVPSLPRTSSV